MNVCEVHIMKTRWLPVAALFVLTPLVAEYLLGSLSFSKEQIGALPVMALLYGSGAILIRELARRTRRGWRAILLLGLAYGLIEEGLLTQSLFNPNYLNLRLLDYGYVSALGVSANWTAYVISLHVIWSVCVPIAFVEALFPSQSELPWLGKGGAITAAVFLGLGMAAVASFSYKSGHFMAHPAQFAGVLVAVVAAIVFAFKASRVPAIDPSLPPAPGVWLAAGFAFIAGSLFCVSQSARGSGVPWLVPVAGIVAVDAISVVAIARWSSRAGWSSLHRFALGAGGILVYAWFGYTVEISLHGRGALWSHSVLVVAILGLVGVAGRRVGRSPPV
jgi:hypothetical protein